MEKSKEHRMIAPVGSAFTTEYEKVQKENAVKALSESSEFLLLTRKKEGTGISGTVAVNSGHRALFASAAVRAAESLMRMEV